MFEVSVFLLKYLKVQKSKIQKTEVENDGFRLEKSTTTHLEEHL